MSSEAFVTLATNDAYALGALTLAQSIRQVGTKRNLVVLISNHLSDLITKSLEKSFDEVIIVDQLNSNDIEHLELLSRPELGITFTKINCWLLEQYSKCVFLDSDCLVLRSIDDLFQREEFSAAPDAGWPDCFNSGVFVYRPSKETFRKLMLFASQHNASFDGGDQGLLNSFFSNWRTADISRHLPFTYNVTANAFYSYLPAVTRFRNDIHVIHFAGALKPWQLTYNPQNEQLSGNLTGQNDVQRDFLVSWWRIMHQRVWPIIQQFTQANSNNTINGQNENGNFSVGSFNYDNLIDNKGIEVGSAAHRRAWEAGHIDYFGRDSFHNIEQQLQRNIEQYSYQQREISPDKISSNNIPQLPISATSILKNSTNGTTSIHEISQQRLIPSHSEDHTKKLSTTNSLDKRESSNEQITRTTAVLNTQRTMHPQYQQINFTNENFRKDEELTKVLRQNITQLPTTTKQSTNPLKSSEESTSLSQHENILPSIHSNENQNPSITDHQTSWTVKSTIITTYQQGVSDLSAPISVSKSVSEVSATSSQELPLKTSIKQISDSSKSSILNETAKRSNEHFAWLFNKVFVAITYTISLCYLLFLVAIGRSKNTNIIHGNGTSIRNIPLSSSTTTTAKNANRMNDDIQ